MSELPWLLCLIAGIAFGLLFLHPYLSYPWTLGRLKPRPQRRRADAPPHSATLVFCAYNEAASIPAKLDNLRAIRAIVPGIRFKCYVDLSSDGSLELLRAHPDLIEVHGATERTGKCLGMRHLAAVADTEVMIFTDANVTVEPASVPRLLAYFDDPEVGGVCGKLIYTNEGESMTADVNSGYWRLEEKIKQRESASGSTMGADGSLFATRRALYPVVPAHLLDDFIVSMSTIFSGHRLVSADDVFAYEKSAAASGDEFRRKRRIAARAYASHRHIWPQVRALSPRDRYKYVSHRWIRWYGAALALASMAFGIVGLGGLLGAGVGIALAVLAAATIWGALKAKSGPLARLGEIVRALWATQLGVADAWRGKRYQTWQPAQSR